MECRYKYLSIVIICLLNLIIIGCADGLTNTNPISGNSLCYQRHDDLNRWEIFSNNIQGTNPVNISNYLGDDEYPQWSPDGKNIVFKRSISIYGPLVFVYNFEKDTVINLTADGGLASNTRPQWTPNGKVYFAYKKPLEAPIATYIMKPDGSEKKKILDTDATIYFYQDCKTFIYIIDSKVYRTDIDNSFNEFIMDFEVENLTIRDFNPLTGKLLANTYSDARFGNSIVEYDVATNQSKLIVTAEETFMLSLQRYSKDYSKVAFIETNTDGYDERYLSVFENGEKKRIVKLVDNESFDWSPIQFSYDGRYISFSKNITQTGSGWFYWKSYLYVVNIKTSELYFIDEAIRPSWNPEF